jgi:hypothetical protein
VKLALPDYLQDKMQTLFEPSGVGNAQHMADIVICQRFIKKAHRNGFLT